MNRALIVCIPVVLLAAGCTTTSFAGLAKASYVEQVSSDGAETQQELEELRARVAEMQELTDQLEQVIAAMEETRAATEELQQLATIVEERLESLPKETLRLLVESIQSFLAE